MKSRDLHPFVARGGKTDRPSAAPESVATTMTKNGAHTGEIGGTMEGARDAIVATLDHMHFPPGRLGGVSAWTGSSITVSVNLPCQFCGISLSSGHRPSQQRETVYLSHP